MASRHDGLIGVVLNDRYELEKLIRPGEYGDYWRARTPEGLYVAVKMLKPDILVDEPSARRFRREVSLLSQWKHPNLMRVLDHGRTGRGVPYIVMEYLEGRPLADDIADLALSVERVCHIGGQIARVLAGAHARGIVHRGLSPEAILLTRRGDDVDHVKVLDFGLAHLANPSDLDEEAEEESTLTLVGQRLGRPEYWAPEYIETYRLDARTDLYVLGLIIFEMLCGQPPFVGRRMAVLMKHVQEQPIRPSELSVLEVPGWVDELVMALLSKNPDDRPADALQVARAFSFRIFPLNARR